MSAQLKQTNKFSLEAGTTNRHHWHKKAVSALQALERLRFEQRELYGTKGGEERESITMLMFGDVVNHKAAELRDEIGERYGWLITRDNADAIKADALKAIAEARENMPVIDNRKTPEEMSMQQSARLEAEKQQEADALAKQAEIEEHKAELMARYPWAMADDGKISNYARAAKNMKKELKIAFPYVKFSITSKSFSMGNSISVRWDNGPSTQQVDEITDKYAYYIDKCTDDGSAKARAVSVVLGQAKYVDTSRDVDETLRNRIKADIAEKSNLTGYDLDMFSGRALHGVEINGDYAGVELIGNEYRAQFKAPEIPQQADTLAASAAHIEEHEHTKRGFLMYMVVLDDRVERDEFTELRDKCKSLGGWYSRQWGKTPGGFAFREQAQAVEFLNLLGGQPTPPITGGDGPTPKKQSGEKFRAMADKLESQIENKMAPRQENTAKRQAQAANARLEGERLKRTQAALYALADMHDTGTVPAILVSISSKKAVYELMSENTTQTGSGFYYYHIGTGEIHDRNKDNPQAVALWSLLTPKSEAEKEAERVAQLVRDVKNTKIDGYFPTPDTVIDKMLDYAALSDYHAVLEPSAGSGAICDRLAAELSEDGLLHCYEVNSTLAEILNAKGYTMAGGDFMETAERPTVTQIYDRVLMNPPFENLQDCDHVRHAYRFLKPGGRLVAIMSPSFTFNSNKKAAAFREWFDSLGGEAHDIEAGAFKESGTMIASKLVIIDKE